MIISKIQIDHDHVVFLYKIYQKINSPDRLIFDTTWAESSDYKIIDIWLNKHPNHKAIVVSWMDPPWNVEDNLKQLLYKEKITRLTSETVYTWLLSSSTKILTYSAEEVAPYENFRYNFLCYQRKPSSNRLSLYETLCQRRDGLITIGTENFNHVNCNLPYHSGYKKQAETEELYIGNDIWSLGNIKIWKSSFLNIVSETTQDFNDSLFLSEKSLKPIIGKRPFIIYGHKKSSNFLKQKGFEIFDEDFGYEPGNCYEDQVKQIEKIVSEIKNPELFYKKLLPKLQHNKEQFLTIANKEWEKLETLINDLN